MSITETEMLSEIDGRRKQDSSEYLQEVLSLEVQILQLLLQRNHRQHRRVQYYRRLDMIHRAIQRYSILSLQPIIYQCFSSESSCIRYKGNQTNKTKPVAPLLPRLDSECTQPDGLRRIQEAVSLHLPETLSRIAYAASALYVELSRGFFAPFCTASLACISRIRVILMQIGRVTVVELMNRGMVTTAIGENQNIVISTARQFEVMIKPYLDIDTKQFSRWRRGNDEKQLKGVSNSNASHHLFSSKQNQREHTTNLIIWESHQSERISKGITDGLDMLPSRESLHGNNHENRIDLGECLEFPADDELQSRTLNTVFTAQKFARQRDRNDEMLRYTQDKLMRKSRSSLADTTCIESKAKKTKRRKKDIFDEIFSRK